MEEMTDILDLKPEGYKAYRKRHGKHFSEELCQFAVSMMTRQDEQGNDLPISPMDKEEVERILNDYNIRLRNNKEYDHVFAANMCKADYLGDSVPDLEHLARYVRNAIDDSDGYDGIVFERWVSDMVNKKVEVPWENFL